MARVSARSQSVVPPGAEVEDYSPTPDNLRSMAQADLLVTNGLQLDSWVPGLVSAARPDITTLVVSDGMPPDTNPHLWLDVQYAKAYVQKIHDALVAQDPQGAETYDANTAAYLAQLDELDAWIVAAGQHAATRAPQAGHVPRCAAVLRRALRLRRGGRDHALARSGAIRR